MKDVVDTLKGMIKNEDRYQRIEGYCIISLIFGALLLSSGIGLTIITPKGLPAIAAMLGALVAFLSTVALVMVWLLEEFTGE